MASASTAPGTTLTGQPGGHLVRKLAPNGPRMVLQVGMRRIVLQPGLNMVGREKGAAVHLNDPSVSRAHARIVVAAGAAAVEDFQSKNGTWVQGLPIHAPTMLADGDEVMFGIVRTRFVVEYGDEPTTQSR